LLGLPGLPGLPAGPAGQLARWPDCQMCRLPDCHTRHTGFIDCLLKIIAENRVEERCHFFLV